MSVKYLTGLLFLCSGYFTARTSCYFCVNRPELDKSSLPKAVKDILTPLAQTEVVELQLQEANYTKITPSILDPALSSTASNVCQKHYQKIRDYVLSQEALKGLDNQEYQPTDQDSAGYLRTEMVHRLRYCDCLVKVSPDSKFAITSQEARKDVVNLNFFVYGTYFADQGLQDPEMLLGEQNLSGTNYETSVRYGLRILAASSYKSAPLYFEGLYKVFLPDLSDSRIPELGALSIIKAIDCVQVDSSTVDNQYFLFGWSSLLSELSREQAGMALYNAINFVYQFYSKLYPETNVFLYTHSHGLGVALNCAGMTSILRGTQKAVSKLYTGSLKKYDSVPVLSGLLKDFRASQDRSSTKDAQTKNKTLAQVRIEKESGVRKFKAVYSMDQWLTKKFEFPAKKAPLIDCLVSLAGPLIAETYPMLDCDEFGFCVSCFSDDLIETDDVFSSYGGDSKGQIDKAFAKALQVECKYKLGSKEERLSHLQYFVICQDNNFNPAYPMPFVIFAPQLLSLLQDYVGSKQAGSINRNLSCRVQKISEDKVLIEFFGGFPGRTGLLETCISALKNLFAKLFFIKPKLSVQEEPIGSTVVDAARLKIALAIFKNVSPDQSEISFVEGEFEESL